jgi:hypothetical protein
MALNLLGRTEVTARVQSTGVERKVYIGRLSPRGRWIWRNENTGNHPTARETLTLAKFADKHL